MDRTHLTTCLILICLWPIHATDHTTTPTVQVQNHTTTPWTPTPVTPILNHTSLSLTSPGTAQIFNHTSWTSISPVIKQTLNDTPLTSPSLATTKTFNHTSFQPTSLAPTQNLSHMALSSTLLPLTQTLNHTSQQLTFAPTKEPRNNTIANTTELTLSKKQRRNIEDDYNMYEEDIQLDILWETAQSNQWYEWATFTAIDIQGKNCLFCSKSPASQVIIVPNPFDFEKCAEMNRL